MCIPGTRRARNEKTARNERAPGDRKSGFGITRHVVNADWPIVRSMNHVLSGVNACPHAYRGTRWQKGPPRDSCLDPESSSCHQRATDSPSKFATSLVIFVFSNVATDVRHRTMIYDRAFPRSGMKRRPLFKTDQCQGSNASLVPDVYREIIYRSIA